MVQLAKSYSNAVKATNDS